MNKTTISGLLILILAPSIISGCRCSSNAGLSEHPTKAIVMLFSQGTSTLIGGIDVTLVLPVGVTVKASPDTINTSKLVTDAGVVTVSGAATGTNATIIGTYTAVTATEAGKIVVHVANADGFDKGEFATVACDIVEGSNPSETGFGVTDFKPVDLNGAAISGLTAGFTVRMDAYVSSNSDSRDMCY